MKHIVLASLVLMALFWIWYGVDKLIPPRRRTGSPR